MNCVFLKLYISNLLGEYHLKSSFSYNLSQVLLKCPCSLPFLSFLRSLWINWHALRVPGCSRTKSARSKMILNLVLAIENDRDGTINLKYSDNNLRQGGDISDFPNFRIKCGFIRRLMPIYSLDHLMG